MRAKKLCSRILLVLALTAAGLTTPGAQAAPGPDDSDHNGGGPPHSGGGPPMVGASPPPVTAPPPPSADIQPPPPPPPPPSASQYTITFQAGRAAPDAAGRAYLQSAVADLKQLAAQNARSRAEIAVYDLGGVRFTPPTGEPYLYAAQISIIDAVGGDGSPSASHRLVRRRARMVRRVLAHAGARASEALALSRARSGGALIVKIDYRPAP